MRRLRMRTYPPQPGKKPIPRPSVRRYESVFLVFESCGVASIFFGGLSVVSLNFWWGVGFIWAGGITIIISICFHHIRPRWRLTGLIAVMLVEAAFTRYIAFAEAPIFAMADIVPGTTPGTILDGITWRDGFTPLRVSIQNETDFDFEDVDIRISPDVSIAEIGLMSATPDVQFHGDATKEAVDIGGQIAWSPRATLAGVEYPLRQLSIPNYRVVCKRLVSHSSMDLIVAVAEVDRERSTMFVTLAPSSSPTYSTSPATYLGVLSPSAVAAYAEKRPTSVHIAATYTAHFKPRTYSDTISIPQTP